jgi:hypothetical protein
MVAQGIRKSLSAKELSAQADGLEQTKKLIKGFDVSLEHQLISLIPNILDLGSDKTHQTDIEWICNEIVRLVNPYAFESVFREITTVFSQVKFQAKVLGLNMIRQYAKQHPTVVASNLYLIIESLISVSSDIKKEVKMAVQDCWKDVCETIENVDITPIIPVMIDGYMNPATKTEHADLFE